MCDKCPGNCVLWMTGPGLGGHREPGAGDWGLLGLHPDELVQSVGRKRLNGGRSPDCHLLELGGWRTKKRVGTATGDPENLEMVWVTVCRG